MTPLLEVRGLSTQITTRRGIVRAVENVSFSVKPGEKVALVGESGCGKSMTARSILRLLPNRQRALYPVRSCLPVRIS